jgi:hypothetical protein
VGVVSSHGLVTCSSRYRGSSKAVVAASGHVQVRSASGVLGVGLKLGSVPRPYSRAGIDTSTNAAYAKLNATEGASAASRSDVVQYPCADLIASPVECVRHGAYCEHDAESNGQAPVVSDPPGQRE